MLALVLLATGASAAPPARSSRDDGPSALGAPPATTGSVGGRITLQERAGVRTADLENAVVWLEPVNGPVPTPPAPPAPEPAVAMETRRFRPMVRVVPVGSAVSFPNDDPFRHNVFSSGGPADFDLGLYGRREARSARFPRSGVYPVFCNIHARMVAYVVAVATPWYAQVGADGGFELDGVPPGRYRLRAWHDRGGARPLDVQVSAGVRSRADVPLDARDWRYVPHKNKHGQDYPPETRDRY